MLTLYDYLPSRNAWKVRQMLAHLDIRYRSVIVSIFEGAGRDPAFLALNPSGRVPVLQLEDGRALAESNAILAYLADDTTYLPGDPFDRAKVHQWLSFEQENVESVIGSLRHWRVTGKDANRDPSLVEARYKGALRTLAILEGQLSQRPFIAGDRYTIADIAIFSYGSLAEDAGIPLAPYPHFRAWIARVASQPDHLGEVVPYADDPNSVRELPG